MKVKLKWRVSEPPSGRFKSFYKRGWPTAEYVSDGFSETIAVMLECEDSYRPEDVRKGTHGLITASIAFWGPRPDGDSGDTWTFKWRRMKARFKSLEEAKSAAESYILAHPEVWPKHLRT